MGLRQAIRIRGLEKAAKLGMASPEQIDELLASPESFTGTDLAAVLSGNPHVTLTPAQWDEVCSRGYFVIPVAAAENLPIEVLRRLARHDLQAVRDEAYLNPSADDDVRAAAVELGVSDDVVNGVRLANRARSTIRTFTTGPVSRVTNPGPGR